MDEITAMILPNGSVVKMSSQLNKYETAARWYSISGYLTRFNLVRNGEPVRFDLFNDLSSTAAFYNYSQVLDFYRDREAHPLSKIEKMEFNQFEPAKPGDIVFTWKRQIDTVEKYYYYKNIKFVFNETYDFTNGIDIPPAADLLPENSRRNEDNPTAVSFFYNNYDSCPDKELLANIGTLIGNIDREIFLVFDETDNPPGQEYQNFVTAQKLVWATEDIINSNLATDNLQTPSNPFRDIPQFDFLEAYRKYFHQLRSFYQDTIEQIRQLETATDKDRIAELISSFHPSVISSFSTEVRIEYLKKVINIPIYNRIMDSPFARYMSSIGTSVGTLFIEATPPKREFTDKFFRAILNIVASFTIDYEEDVVNRNAFLTELATADGDKVTLFEKIYDILVDNVAIDKMVGNLTDDETLLAQYKRQFAVNLYSIWLSSSQYNPYYDYSLETDNLSTAFLQTNSYNYGPDSPMVLDYQADKTWTFFFDNYVFEFNDGKITAHWEVPLVGDWGIVRKKTGTYHIFQPVHLVQENINNEVYIPIPKLTNKSPFDPSDAENPANVIIPIFYLKYVDDSGDLQDLITGAELVVDVTATFMGAGLLANLKYLRYISPARKLMVLTAEGTEFVLASAAVVSLKIGVGVLAVISLTAGVIRLAIKYLYQGCTVYRGVIFDNNGEPLPPQEENYNTPEEYAAALDEYNAYDLCKAMDKWMFRLELLSIGGQLAGLYALQKASQRMLTAYNNLSPAEKAAFNNNSMQYANPGGSVSVITGQQLIDEVRVFALMESQVADFLQYINANNLTSLASQLSILTAEESALFTSTFYRTGQNSNNLLNALQRLNSNTTSVANWKYLFNRSLPEAEFVEIITNGTLISKYQQFFNQSSLQSELLKLSTEQRINMFTNINLIPARFSHVSNNPRFIALFGTSEVSLISTDTLLFEDVYIMLDRQLNNSMAHFLSIRNQISIPVARREFIQIRQTVSISNLSNLYYQYTSQFPKLLTAHNRLFVNIKSYSGNNTLISSVDELYVSGKQNKVIEAFNNSASNFPALLREPTNYQNFVAFTQRARELDDRARLYDTELKFIYNFLTTHFPGGAARYDIEMTSLISSCESCQRYLRALEVFGEASGITINIIFKDNPAITALTELINRL